MSTKRLNFSAEEINSILTSVGIKIGYQKFYESDSTYRYFADLTSCDLYESDPETYGSLVIAKHEGQFPYYAVIDLLTPNSVGILSNTAGNYIKFNFDIKNNRTNLSTGEGINCTITVINGAITRIKKFSKSYGETVNFLIDDMLSNGTNTINIKITGKNNTSAEAQSVVTYNVYALDINLEGFNFTTPFTDTLTIPYLVSASPVKYVEWYIDGVISGTPDIVQNPTYSGTKYINIASLTSGLHTLEARMYILYNTETKFYSKTVHYDFIKGQPTGIFILVNADLDQLALTTNNANIQLTGTLYQLLNFTYAIYDSRERELAVKVSKGTELLSLVSKANGDEEEFTYQPSTYGNMELTIKCQDTTKTISLNIAASSIGMNEATTDLSLKLVAKGRSNSEETPDTWTYGDYSTTFTGVNFDLIDGWSGGALVLKNGATIDIDYIPFLSNPLLTGKTIEIDFSTDDVIDDNAVVGQCINNGIGFNITATKATLTSSSGTLTSSNFKPRERTKIAFVINKLSGTEWPKFIYMINNGVVCFPAVCPNNDTFTNNNLTIKFGNSSGLATIKIYSIRIYDRALTTDEELGNYAIDSTNPALVATNNDVYEEGTTTISVEKVKNTLPTLMITCSDFLTILDATDKSTSVTAKLSYTHPTDETLNFTAGEARIRKLGTSSLSYPRPNLKIDKYKLLKDYQENDLGDAYAFKHGSCPCTVHTWKTDFMESSMSHNTGIARLWNSIFKEVQVDNQYVCRTAAQQAAISSSHPYDIRTTVDGFPAAIFYRTSDTSEPIFLGLYNFNNDKASLGVFGWDTGKYKILGYDPSNTECWEMREEDGLCLMDDISTWDSNWSTYFEGRQPDGNEDTTYLKQFATWVSLTKIVTGFNSDGTPIVDQTKLSKWKSEKANHLDEWKMAGYYIYTIYYAAVDQITKNSMLTTEDRVHWFFINYDNDTIKGLDNGGYLKFLYNLMRGTITDPNSEYKYGYQGRESVLFNNFEADNTDEFDENGNRTYTSFMSKVKILAGEMYKVGLSYEKSIDMFVNKQSKLFCERLHNASQEFKYFRSYLEGKDYLYACQGTREAHARYFLSKRSDLLESMWAFGSYISKAITFRSNGADVSGGHDKIKIVAGDNHYYGWRSNNTNMSVGNYLETGSSLSMPTGNITYGNIIYVMGANKILKFDLSDFIENLAVLNVSGAYDSVTGTKLKSLILSDKGVSGKYNTALTAIPGLGYLTDLEELDVTNYRDLRNLDNSIAKLVNLKKFYAGGCSKITTFLPAGGANFTEVVLPNSLQVLTLEGGSIGTLLYTPTNALRVININNTTGINTLNLLKTWSALDDVNFLEALVTLKNINWSMSPSELISIKLKFTNANNSGGLVLTGYIKLTSLSYQLYTTIVELFGPNVFDRLSTLRIDADDAVYISAGNGSVLSGKTLLVVSIVFPIGNTSTVTYKMYDTEGFEIASSSLKGVTLNTETGLLTAAEELEEDEFEFKVKAISSLGITSDFLTILATKLYYAESFTVNSGDLVTIPRTSVFTLTNTASVNWDPKVNLLPYDFAILSTGTLEATGTLSKISLNLNTNNVLNSISIYTKQSGYETTQDTYIISWRCGNTIDDTLLNYSLTIIVTALAIKISEITITGVDEVSTLNGVTEYNISFAPSNANINVVNWNVMIESPSIDSGN